MPRGKKQTKGCKSNTDSIGSEKNLWAILGKYLFRLFSSYSEGTGNTAAADCYSAVHYTVRMLKETPKYLNGIMIFV